MALIRPRFLGDVCLTLPALDAVRQQLPNASIAYVTEAGNAPLLEGDPRIDELIVVPRSPRLSDTWSLRRKLRSFGPDVVFDFFCNPRTAVWSRLSGARIRVGYPHKGWRSSLYTHHAAPRTLSATEFHMASLRSLGWNVSTTTPRLHIAEARREEARAALREIDVPDDALLVGFHPGARWPTRRWPAERYEALAERFLEAHRDGIALFTAGPGEERVALAIARSLGEARARAIQGWPIARFVALQSLCRAFVVGDTGPLHTSVAAGTRTLGLISRNRPAMFFPYPEADGHRAYYTRAECSPCHRDTCDDLRCLTGMTVEGAWKFLSGMLEA